MINYVKVLKTNLQSEDYAGPKKTFAAAQSRDTLSLEQVAEHIAQHGSTYDAGDVLSIGKKLAKCVREFLLDGYNVQLGDLGTFYVTLRSKGVYESVPNQVTGEKPVFTAANITGVNVVWRRGEQFGNLISAAKFQEVPTRDEQHEQIRLRANERGE